MTMTRDDILGIWFGLFSLTILIWIRSSLNAKGEKLFAALEQQIEQSLKRYPNRQTTRYNRTVNWSCAGRRFDFFISLQQRYWTSRVSVWFHCEANRTLEMRFSHGRMKMSGINDAYEKKLVAEKSFTAISEQRETFDRIIVKKDRIQAIKTYRRMIEVDAWPDALGGLITLVRYLLDFENRKEITARGEPVCPYCRAAVEEKQAGVFCRECKTLHHHECWNEIGRCSIFGCRGKMELAMRP
ncbi:MAG TPA: RING finger protein [Acidobacteriota bacterium]|nr:RING finger protein [Acidobacteriota bacterium]